MYTDKLNYLFIICFFFFGCMNTDKVEAKAPRLCGDSDYRCAIMSIQACEEGSLVDCNFNNFEYPMEAIGAACRDVDPDTESKACDAYYAEVYEIMRNAYEDRT